MGGQAIERRQVMRLLALASMAGRAHAFERYRFGCPHGHPDGDRADASGAPYVPRFFSAEEYRTVELLAEHIIPNDGAPGAGEAGVSEFIDFMASSDPDIQLPFRGGLAWLDSHAARLEGAPFRELSPDSQVAILERLAYEERHRDGEEEGRAFFALMREYTVMGFYTSRTGLEQLDYPGLKLYAEHPGCPHTGDREHRFLPRAED